MQGSQSATRVEHLLGRVLEGRGQTSEKVGKQYLKEDGLRATSHLGLWAFVV